MIFDLNVKSKILKYIIHLTSPYKMLKLFEVIKGSSEFTDVARDFGHNAGETVTFEWIVQPTEKAAGWTIPLNIAFKFYDRDKREGYPLSLKAPNIMVHDEHYSGPAPARTTTDPSSTNQSPSQGSPGFGGVGALMGILLAVVYRAGRA